MIGSLGIAHITHTKVVLATAPKKSPTFLSFDAPLSVRCSLFLRWHDALLSPLWLHLVGRRGTPLRDHDELRLLLPTELRTLLRCESVWHAATFAHAATTFALATSSATLATLSPSHAATAAVLRHRHDKRQCEL